MFKLTGLSNFQTDALRQVFAGELEAGLFTSTKSTASWTDDFDPFAVFSAVSAFMDREASAGRTRHHPRASLHAVLRKLDPICKAEALSKQEVLPDMPEPQTAPDPTSAPAASGEPQENLEEASERAELASTLGQTLSEEIDELERKRAAYDADAAKLQEQKYAAEDAGDEKTAKKRHDAMLRALNVASATAEKIAVLRTPEELQRRVSDRIARNQQRERLNALAGKEHGMADKATTAKKSTKVTAKSQGFPDAYLGPEGNFRPGMDARAKSDLILSIVGATKGETAKMLVQFTEADAQKLIKARGWEHFLSRKQEIQLEKAAKSEAKRTEARAKVAAKKNGKTTGTVQPDPQPTRRQKAAAK